MDPISIIGTAGSIENIIDVVAKVIKTIRELTDEYKEADLRFMTLVTQLTALRAAFKKIQEWMDSDLVGNPYHQLVMDLDVSMSCCRLLAGKIEAMLIELREEEEGKLNVSSKVKLVFNQKDLDGLQKFVTQQTAALTLLLTACNCKTLSDQKALLEKSSTRRVVRRMEADTASLFVHRDSDSFMTQMTDRLSKLSVEFAFDWELFITKVYERALRGSVKKSIRTRTVDLEAKEYIKTPKLDYKAMKRSQAIDQRLEEDLRRLRRECKILILGSADEKDQIITQMRIVYGNGYSKDELKLYRLTVYKSLMDSVTSLISAMQQFGIEPEREDNKAMCRMLMEYDVPVDHDVVIDKTIGDAISSVWTDPCIPMVMEHASEFHLMDNAPYFFDEAERITSGDYVPTEVDILRAKTKTTGIYETRFTMGQLSIQMLDVSGQRSERKKWIHCFEDVTSIIFVVNLADYDQVLLEENSQNRMMESLVLFDSVVNSRWFMNTSIILFLSNVQLFKRKLAHSPLSNYFPDYSGGNDVNRAAKYILWRFNQVNRAHLNLYPHLVHTDDTSHIQLVFAAVKETILHNALRSGPNPIFE